MNTTVLRSKKCENVITIIPISPFITQALGKATMFSFNEDLSLSPI